MSEAVAKQINKLIEQLHADRKVHADAIAEIDEAFASLGISPGAVSTSPSSAATSATGSVPAKGGLGRPKKTAKSSPKKTGKRAGRRGRGNGGQTADEFVMSLLDGRAKMTTGEINQAWTRAGRKGSANTTLSNLVKSGTIKRENIPGERGSHYSRA